MPSMTTWLILNREKIEMRSGLGKSVFTCLNLLHHPCACCSAGSA